MPKMFGHISRKDGENLEKKITMQSRVKRRGVHVFSYPIVNTGTLCMLSEQVVLKAHIAGTHRGS